MQSFTLNPVKMVSFTFKCL